MVLFVFKVDGTVIVNSEFNQVQYTIYMYTII